MTSLSSGSAVERPPNCIGGSEVNGEIHANAVRAEYICQCFYFSRYSVERICEEAFTLLMTVPLMPMEALARA